MFCDQLFAIRHLLCTRDGTPGSLIWRGSAPQFNALPFIYGQLLREKSPLLYNLLINLPHTYIVVWNFAVLFNCCENTVFKT